MKTTTKTVYVIVWPNDYDLELHSMDEAMAWFYDEVDDPEVANGDKPLHVIKRTITDEVIS